MNKGFKITIIVLLSLLFIVFSGCFVLLLRGNDYNNFNFNFGLINEESQNLLFEREYGNDYSKVLVTSKVADVKFIKSENSNFSVKVYGEDENDLSIEEKDGNLVISYILEKKQKIRFGFNIQAPRVEVYVPDNYSGNFDVNSSVGDVKIGSFKNVDAIVKATTGDVKVTSINDLDVTLNTGDVKVNKVNNLTVNGSIGDVKITNVKHANIKLNTGDVKIDNVNGDITVNGDVGDVKIEKLNLTKDSLISLNTGDVKVESTNEIYFDAKTNIGDVKINNNYRDGKCVLKIKNNIGDINIEN